jgi:signal peptidase I
MAMKEQAIDTKEEKESYSWNETIKTVLIALLLAVLFRSFAYEPFHIPSGSMKSNLLVGDYLFVSKYTYGYSRYSFPLGIMPIKNRLWAKEPERGDVAVFRLPINPRIDYIKRVMGLPGDRIQLKRGVVYINGKALERHYADNYTDDESMNSVRSVPRFEELLPEGKRIFILKERKFGGADDTEEYVVPAGHYFMMGDNRDNSRDSRYMTEVGFVPFANFVGRAEMIFFSMDQSVSLYNPISWFTGMRYDRFFKSID